MKLQAKKIPYKPMALACSVFAILIWSILGTGTSLAWFTDVSSQLTNIFHVAKFDVVVSHRLTDGNWEEIDSNTRIFEENALYEPGYVQVAYLKAENQGTVPFELSVAVNINGCIVATNVFGQSFMLQDYLKFGLTTADTEEEMKASISNREASVEIADMPLHNYDTETMVLSPSEIKYLAIVVRMPEEVGDVANYRGDTVPVVELGITIKADQIRE